MEGFTDDLKRFFIDQPERKHTKTLKGSATAYFARKLQDIGESPAAFALFGGDRVGARQWHDTFYEDHDPRHNQAHHLAAFIISGIYQHAFLADTEAIAHDLLNPPDIYIGIIGSHIGSGIRKGLLTVNNLYTTIYKTLKKEFRQ